MLKMKLLQNRRTTCLAVVDLTSFYAFIFALKDDPSE